MLGFGGRKLSGHWDGVSQMLTPLSILTSVMAGLGARTTFLLCQGSLIPSAQDATRGRLQGWRGVGAPSLPLQTFHVRSWQAVLRPPALSVEWYLVQFLILSTFREPASSSHLPKQPSTFQGLSPNLGPPSSA